MNWSVLPNTSLKTKKCSDFKPKLKKKKLLLLTCLSSNKAKKKFSKKPKSKSLLYRKSRNICSRIQSRSCKKKVVMWLTETKSLLILCSERISRSRLRRTSWCSCPTDADGFKSMTSTSHSLQLMTKLIWLPKWTNPQRWHSSCQIESSLTLLSRRTLCRLLQTNSPYHQESDSLSH